MAEQQPTARPHTLFVLLPTGKDVDAWLGEVSLREPSIPHLRRYPSASDGRHLLSLVRAGRDRVATRWLAGMVWAVLGGAVLGAIVNGVLAGAFGMLGGLVEIAVALGLPLGAFLGGFTAAMAGTEVARDEVKGLAAFVQPDDVLLQCGFADREQLVRWRTLAATQGLQTATIG